MNTLFENNDGIKRRKCDRNVQKDMRIPVDTYKNKIDLLQLNQKIRVNWNLKIIYGYHFLINYGHTLQVLYIKFW